MCCWSLFSILVLETSCFRQAEIQFRFPSRVLSLSFYLSFPSGHFPSPPLSLLYLFSLSECFHVYGCFMCMCLSLSLSLSLCVGVCVCVWVCVCVCVSVRERRVIAADCA